MKRILVVDDDQASCDLLGEIFASQDWATESALTPEAAITLSTGKKFDLIISDINLESEQSGLDLLKQLRSHCPVILVTGFGSLDSAVAAAREGAWDFISKPFQVEEVIGAAGRALDSADQAHSESKDASPELLAEQLAQTGIVGRSPAMIELYNEIARVAPTRSTVLILGDSGTGKELVARAIHQHSPRTAGPFVPVNCGALTETLLEAELFGHVRGSFTGATSDRKGLWEEAGGGTLFLDEIGETSPAMQVKLLRALQEGEVRRVGGTRALKVDTRVIAATNRDLEKEMKDGSFREDLYYRLSVVTLRVPPLRERRSDIPLLTSRFLRIAAENAAKEHLHLSEETVNRLFGYDWPGNVRELESAIEHAALHARGTEVTPDDLPDKLQSENVRTAARSSLFNMYGDLPTIDELERRYLIHVLKIVENNRTRAAEVFGVDRRTLYRMAERFGVNLDGE